MKQSLLFIFLMAVSFSVQALNLSSMWLNRQGVSALKNQKPAEALSLFSEALALSPDSTILQINIGLAFEALGQLDKAIQAYQAADQFADGPETQFVARFNRGALLQKQKKVDEALAAYHGALEVQPESRETKINIELLITDQQKKQGEGEGEEKKDPQGNSGKGKDQDKKDQQKKDEKKDDKGEGDQKKDQPKQYGKNKPQPQEFKSPDLNKSDVNKILSELRNQEQKIRAEYNKREVKERPRGKDW